MLNHNIAKPQDVWYYFQMFGHNNVLHRSIAFNSDQIVPPIMGDMCIM
jgi:hypothetical protein